MNVLPISNSPKFNALNCRYLNYADSRTIIKDIRVLEELGEKYDIKLVSKYDSMPEFAAIDIIVQPLAADLKLLRRLVVPQGQSSFRVGQAGMSDNSGASVVDSVQEAIKNLNNKLH